MNTNLKARTKDQIGGKLHVMTVKVIERAGHFVNDQNLQEDSQDEQAAYRQFATKITSVSETQIVITNKREQFRELFKRDLLSELGAIKKMIVTPPVHTPRNNREHTTSSSNVMSARSERSRADQLSNSTLFRNHLCSEPISVARLSGLRSQSSDGNLEEIGEWSALILMKDAIPFGTRVRVKGKVDELKGIVRSHTFDRLLGFFIEIELDVESRWSEKWFVPQHLLKCPSIRDLTGPMPKGSERHPLAKSGVIGTPSTTWRKDS